MSDEQDKAVALELAKRHTSGCFRMRDHWTLARCREMQGMHQVALCEARRNKIPFTECTEMWDTGALMPVLDPYNPYLRFPKDGVPPWAKATGSAS